MKSYIELKLYKKYHDIFVLNIIATLFIFALMLSIYKTTNYENFRLLKSNNSYFISCDKNCNLIEKNNVFYINNSSSKYKIITHANNIYEVRIDGKIIKEGLSNIGIKNGKIRLYKKLFNIYRQKGLT